MSRPAIRVEGLGKRYRLAHGQDGDSYRTLRDTIVDFVKAPLRKRGSVEEFWAVNDVSFEIQQGEVVGIIGRNGAGKSTLLKILSRITKPSKGRVEINGRVGSLLEVGTGFHPELTGRENIYLNGSILGMGRKEIDRNFDAIVAFAEVEKFLDTPVKRYSSGMYVRLAFGVAAHLQPEILIVDEVLAVGDVEFQKKCLGKMGDAAKSGRTVLFVSHNMAAVEQLTSRSILLQRGLVSFDGKTRDAVSSYLKLTSSDKEDPDVENIFRQWPQLRQEVQFIKAQVDHEHAILAANEPIRLRFRFRANENVSQFRLGATIFRFDGVPVGSWFTDHISAPNHGEEADFIVQLNQHTLAPGKYYFGTSTGRGDHKTGHVDYDIILNVLHFEVRPPEGDKGTMANWHANWGCIIFPSPSIEKVQ